MSKSDERAASPLCHDDELGYQRNRTRFLSGMGMVLDEAYRCAHLPLIAPGHPSVISTRAGTTYNMGRHDRMYSLVLPVSADALLASAAYQELERELRASCFAPKIAWELLERRRDKLHATICSSLSMKEAPSFDERQRRKLTDIGPIRVEIRGLFSGNVNVGRLYLRVYPEKQTDRNSCQEIQYALNRPQTDMYLIGIFNLTDNLEPVEASALDLLLQQWWSKPFMEFNADHLWLLGASDDLVLDGDIVETISLA